MAVVVSKKNAALNTIVRSNSVNALYFVHGLNRTNKNTIMKYFNTKFNVVKYAGAIVAMPSSATAYNPYQEYNTM
jgi:predicted SAM-dependent methyltransferase